MVTTHITGFPRIGAKRELKFSIEKFWRGESNEQEVFAVAREIRRQNRTLQHEAHIDLIPAGDFSYYDHVLDTQILVGAIPERFNFDPEHLTLADYSALARGNADEPAIEMTKWFDTNYHYLVPEWNKNTRFKAVSKGLLQQVEEAKTEGLTAKPTIIGPLTLLWLGKVKGENFDRLTLLPQLITVYRQILDELSAAGVTWVHLDEPILAVDLADTWLQAFTPAYEALTKTTAKIMLGTYFASAAAHASLLKSLPVQGLHIDAVRAPEQVQIFLADWPQDKILSLGVIDGRNVWRANLAQLYADLVPVHRRLGDRLWLSASCSLLHTPQDLAAETALAPELKNWLAFAVQKIAELGALKKALENGIAAVQTAFDDSARAVGSRAISVLIHKPAVKERLATLSTDADRRLNIFPLRKKAQQEILNLPLLPTTTIGSFPQTREIRHSRALFKKGELSTEQYERAMRQEIAQVIREQEELDLDVLVHGEAERNDMVEYFGEKLAGFAFTQFGWVQSYGSRCVKPPIIFGDVARAEPMTVSWSTYAQSLTTRPVKGMLTGPVTMLQWSFVRNDLPRSEVAYQIALALNDEVSDLEQAGIKVIQIDEPAYREGLPLQRKDWDEYLKWAGKAFRLTCAQIKDTTQIHTHMCYSEFHDILPAIAAMDADVITIETSRSDMELLDAFAEFRYPNDVGPGVYDIHSPRVPTREEIRHLLQKALAVIPSAHLWVNPDCGLKTRGWEETKAALAVMVTVAKDLRATLRS